MVNQALIDVVKNQLAGGVSEVDIREFLQRRGTSEDEIWEIFDVLSANAPALRDIPVAGENAVPAEQPAIDSAPAPATSIAHGVERDVPPLTPSVPFVAPSVIENSVVAPQASVVPLVQGFEDLSQDLGYAPVSAGIVLPPVLNRKRRFFIIGAVIGAAVLLIAGSVYAYYAYFASPDTVMDRMFSNLRDVHSVAFSSEIIATTSGAQPSATSSDANPFASIFAVQEGLATFTLNALGVVDELDAGNPKLAVALEVAMGKGPLGDLKAGGEYRNLDRKNYIRVNVVPDLGFFDLSFLKDKWFVIEDKEAKAQFGASMGSSDTVLPTVTQEQRDQLAATWEENRFVTVSEELPSEDVDGVSAHHYKLAFDKEAFKAWVITTDAILQNEPTDPRELGERLALLTINDFEIWIGKWDVLPHKIVLQATVRSKKDSNQVSDMVITFTGKDYNEVQDITAPDGAQSFEEVLQGVFGQMLGTGAPTAASATPQERNIQRKSNIAVIANAIKQNIEDNGGTFACTAGPLPQRAAFLSRAGFGATGYVIEPCIVPKYLSELPKDPSKGTAASSGYSAFYDLKTKRITVRAPYAEGGVKISVTK